MIENFDSNYTSYSDIQSLRRSGSQSLGHYGQCGGQGISSGQEDNVGSNESFDLVSSSIAPPEAENGEFGQHPGKFQQFQGQYPQQHGQFPQHQGQFPQGQYPLTLFLPTGLFFATGGGGRIFVK